MKRTKLRRISKRPEKRLKDKLWKIFTLYVKERDKWTCFTCGAAVTGRNANGGHFIPKSVGGLALYFHPDNVHCQCVYCNLTLAGNQYAYGKKLGEAKVQELQKLKGQIIKDYPYEKWIAFYTTKLAEVRSNLEYQP